MVTTKAMQSVSMPLDREGNAVQVLAPIGNEQNIAVEAGANQSDPFPAGCHVIRVCADVPCRIKIGPAAEDDSEGVIATAVSMMFPSEFVEYFRVQEGMALSVIRRGGSDGNLSLQQM